MNKLTFLPMLLTALLSLENKLEGARIPFNVIVRELTDNSFQIPTYPWRSPYTLIRDSAADAVPGSGYWEYERPYHWHGGDRPNILDVSTTAPIPVSITVPILHATGRRAESLTILVKTVFGTDDPLTIVAPHFDYARAINFAVDFRKEGNHLQLDAFQISPGFVTRELRIPEDLRKQYVHPIDTLPAGDYTVTARSWDLNPSFETVNVEDPLAARALSNQLLIGPLAPLPVDFDAFRADPMAFSGRPGWGLHLDEQTFSFTVVPEPASGTLLSLAISALGLACTRRRNR